MKILKFHKAVYHPLIMQYFRNIAHTGVMLQFKMLL